jgi:hypothetical protein
LEDTANNCPLHVFGVASLHSQLVASVLVIVLQLAWLFVRPLCGGTWRMLSSETLFSFKSFDYDLICL